ncbi:hypothetical protein J7M02_06850 [Candidatus Aerophobetes bacterium]|nr:hypothetical protein [Candidatus Aerophobetes bacterium]
MLKTTNDFRGEITEIVKKTLENWGWDAECDRCGARYDGLYFPTAILDEAIQEIAEEIISLISLKEEEEDD